VFNILVNKRLRKMDLSATKRHSAKYAMEVSKYAFNPFESTSNGLIAAPHGGLNTRLYTRETPGSIACEATTKSVMFVFDPEPTMRNGQGALFAFEKSSTGDVTKTHYIATGRAATEFHSCGVVSSSLMIENSSSENDISGSQSAMVMYSLPRNLVNLSVGDAINLLISRERDSVQNLRCSTDYTVTTALSSHLGASQQITRDDSISGPYYNIDKRFPTSGDYLGDSTLTDANPFARATLASALSFTGNPLHYSGDSATSPYTISTFKVGIDFSARLYVTTSAASQSSMDIELTAVALDHAGNVIATDTFVSAEVLEPSGATAWHISASFTLLSTTLPIAETVIYGKTSHPTGTAYGSFGSSVPTGVSAVSANYHSQITAYEGILGCESRPVHVHIVEGLKSDAVLSFNTGLLIAAEPSSNEAGIANVANTAVHDPNMVRMMFEVIGRNMDRAYSGAGYNLTMSRLEGIIQEDAPNGDDASGALAAASMGELVRGMKKVGRYAKATRTMASQVARTVEPFADVASDMAIASGNPKAMAAGMALKSGLSAVGSARKLGLLD
jgi:hypothetical protein